MSSVLRSACLVYGLDSHHLDHLAPLSILFKIPLLVTEEEMAVRCHTYYPKAQTLLYDYNEIAISAVRNYEVLFTCLPRDLFDDIFFFSQQLLGKFLHSVWCPHGNSDKGRDSFYMQALQKEKFALTYGKRMQMFLQEKNVFSQLVFHLEIGNYRHLFYQEEKSFYQGLMRENLQNKLSLQKKTILYAPTWKDRENSSSFFTACPHLIENLPSYYNLIIKPHPNLFKQAEEETNRLIETYSAKENILFLNDFPPIYPLLDAVDMYIGDMSSIGYDFLTFNKPMYFLNETRKKTEPESRFLHECGISLLPDAYKEIYDIIERTVEEQKNLSPMREKTYQETFEALSYKQIEQGKNALLEAINSFQKLTM